MIFYSNIYWIIMYSALKARKIWVQIQSQSPLNYCCFINDSHILLVLENRQFSIVNINSHHATNIVWSSCLPTNDIIIDCKRITLNTCVLLNKQKDRLIALRFQMQETVVTKIVAIDPAIFSNSPTSYSEIISFSQDYFAILDQNFEEKNACFFIFNVKDQQSFDFQTTARYEEMQWVNSNYEIIKPLKKSKEFVIFKQSQVVEVSWRTRFISIKKQYQEKSIDMHDFLTDEHSLMDVLIRDTNQYYLFTKRCIKAMKKQVMQIWKCRLNNNHGNFVQSCQLMINYGFRNINFIQIITIDYQRKTFLTNNYQNVKIEDQYYNNSLELISLDTGVTLEKLECNLKSVDVSSNKQMILDYSQEINYSDRVAIHLRTLLSKKGIYHFLLQNSTKLAREELSPSFQTQILYLL